MIEAGEREQYCTQLLWDRVMHRLEHHTNAQEPQSLVLFWPLTDKCFES